METPPKDVKEKSKKEPKRLKRKECFPLSCMCGKKHYFPQRFIAAILTFCMVVVSYMNRVLFIFVVPQITFPIEGEEGEPLCPPKEPYISPSGETKQLAIYAWDNDDQSRLLGAYYYGYPVFMVASAYLATLYGAKYVLCTSIAVSSIIMCIMPTVLGYGGDGKVAYWGSFVLRILQGVFEGGIFCNISGMISGWIPKNERGALGYIIFCGTKIGTFLGFFVGGKIIAAYGNWKVLFYAYGCLSALVLALFFTFCHSNFEKHPFLTDKEYAFLKEVMPSVKKARKKIPWKGIFTCMPYYSLLFTSIVYDFIFMSIQNELPKYMKNMLGFNTDELAVFTALPYIFSILSGISSGLLSDYIERKQLLNITKTRKIFIILGMMAPAVFAFLAVLCTCTHIAVICMFVLAVGSMGFYSAGWVNYCDISPGFSAFLTSIANTLTACQGFISSLIVGAIVGKEPSFKKWWGFMGLVLCLSVAGSILYAIFGSAVRQKWDEDACAESEKEAAQTKPPQNKDK